MAKQAVNDNPGFVNSRGLFVKVAPVSMFEIEYAQAGIKQRFIREGRQITPPTYEVIVGGGAKQTFEHDEKSLDVTPDMVDAPTLEERTKIAAERTIANKLAWQQYVSNVAEMEERIGRARSEIIFEGILNNPPEDGSWQRKMERRGIELPDDPEELRVFYLMSEVLKTPGDMSKAISEIMLLSASGTIDRAEVEAATARFLTDMAEERRKQAASRT